MYFEHLFEDKGTILLLRLHMSSLNLHRYIFLHLNILVYMKQPGSNLEFETNLGSNLKSESNQIHLNKTLNHWLNSIFLSHLSPPHVHPKSHDLKVLLISTYFLISFRCGTGVLQYILETYQCKPELLYYLHASSFFFSSSSATCEFIFAPYKIRLLPGGRWWRWVLIIIFFLGVQLVFT